MSITKYHVNPATGNTSVCNAKKGRCPFGDESQHYFNESSARMAYENKMATDQALRELMSATLDLTEAGSQYTLAFKGEGISRREAIEKMNAAESRVDAARNRVKRLAAEQNKAGSTYFKSLKEEIEALSIENDENLEAASAGVRAPIFDEYDAAVSHRDREKVVIYRAQREIYKQILDRVSDNNEETRDKLLKLGHELEEPSADRTTDTYQTWQAKVNAIAAALLKIVGKDDVAVDEFVGAKEKPISYYY